MQDSLPDDNEPLTVTINVREKYLFKTQVDTLI